MRYSIYLLVTLVSFSAWGQWRSGRVEPSFNPRDQGDRSLFAGLSRDQTNAYFYQWYSNPVSSRMLRNKGVLLYAPYQGGPCIVDSTGSISYSGMGNRPVSDGQGLEPFDQLPSGRVLGVERFYGHPNVRYILRAELPDGTPDHSYDTVDFVTRDVMPLGVLDDGRVFVLKDDGNGYSRYVYLTKTNGGLDSSFQSIYFGGLVGNSPFETPAAGRVQGTHLYFTGYAQGARFFHLDASLNQGSFAHSWSIPAPDTGYFYEYGNIVQVDGQSVYLRFLPRGSTHPFICRFSLDGQQDSLYGKFQLPAYWTFAGDRAPGKIWLASSLQLFEISLRDKQIGPPRTLPQWTARTEAPIKYRPGNNCLVYPSGRVLTTASLDTFERGYEGPGSRDVIVVLPDNSLDSTHLLAGGYGPVVQDILQVNANQLFVHGPFKWNGLRTEHPYGKVNMLTGAMSPIRFHPGDRMVRAAENDTYYLIDTLGYRRLEKWGSDARPAPGFHFADSNRWVANVFPRRDGSFYAVLPDTGKAHIRLYDASGARMGMPEYSLPLDWAGYYRVWHLAQANLLPSGGLCLYFPNAYIAPYPIGSNPVGRTRLVVLDSGRVLTDTLPTRQECKAFFPLPGGGYGVRCQDDYVAYYQPRESFILNEDLTVNTQRTAALGAYNLLNVQSDGGLLVCNDATRQLLRLMPDGTPDPAWDPITFEGGFANIHVCRDDRLYAYGAFHRLGAVGRTNLALLDSRLATGGSARLPRAGLLTVHPNPGYDRVYFGYTKGVIPQQFVVSDAVGRQVYQSGSLPNAGLSVQGWPAGMYEAILIDASQATHRVRFCVR